MPHACSGSVANFVFLFSRRVEACWQPSFCELPEVTQVVPWIEDRLDAMSSRDARGARCYLLPSMSRRLQAKVSASYTSSEVRRPDGSIRYGKGSVIFRK